MDESARWIGCNSGSVSLLTNWTTGLPYGSWTHESSLGCRPRGPALSSQYRSIVPLREVTQVASAKSSATPGFGIGHPPAEEHVETVETRLRGQARRCICLQGQARRRRCLR